MRRTLVAATVACLAALSTTGCGATDPSIPSPGSSPVAGSTTETGNADAVHACDLLTEQIALAVLNRPVTLGNGGNVDIYHFGVRQSSCGYVSDDGNLPVSSVHFSVLAPVDDSGVQYVKDAYQIGYRINGSSGGYIYAIVAFGEGSVAAPWPPPAYYLTGSQVKHGAKVEYAVRARSCGVTPYYSPYSATVLTYDYP